MNVWSFTGNLGKDAEVRTTQNGKQVCSFSVAVKSGYGQNEKTTWVQCAMFGAKAEGQLPQHLTKGTQVAISGEAFLDEWENNGQQNKMLKLSVNTITLIGGRQDNSSQGFSPQPMQQQQAVQQQGFQPQQAPQQPYNPQSVGAQNAGGVPQTPQGQNFDPSFDDSIPY